MRPQARNIVTALALCVAGALPAQAQDTATTETDPVPPAQDQTGAAAGDPARVENQVTIRDTFGDWEVRCAPDNAECFMYQLVHDDQNNPVIEFRMVRIEDETDAKAGVNALAPLGTLLTNGLVLQIDDGELRRFPFAWCDHAGCFARLALNQESVDAMKGGSVAKLTVFSIAAPNLPITVELSLNGFTASYDSMKPVDG